MTIPVFGVRKLSPREVKTTYKADSRGRDLQPSPGRCFPHVPAEDCTFSRPGSTGEADLHYRPGSGPAGRRGRRHSC